MTFENEPGQAFYDIRDISAEQRSVLIRHCNESWARSRLRKLRALIQFAMSEPDCLAGYDEDTGKFGLHPQYEVHNSVLRLADQAFEDPCTAAYLKRFGWTEETTRADWATMLALLPADQLQPLPWPGE